MEKAVLEVISNRNYTEHALERFQDYNIDILEFGRAITKSFEILEEYPSDPRGRSCLILTYIDDEPIHAVIAPWQKELIVITVYIPSRDKWIDERTRRRK